MYLPDPRIYPTGLVKNSVISQLNTVLAENDASRKQEKQATLEFLLSQYMEQDQQEALVVALSLAPSHVAYQHLWQTIKALLMPKETIPQAQIFAIPIIMVAGARSAAVLPGKLNQTHPIIQYLQAHQVVAPRADLFLDSHLYTAETLAGISLPQLYRWQSALQYASAGVPIQLTSTPISFTKQGVFLRYLLGVAMRNHHTPVPVQFDQKIGAWGLTVAEYIQQDLQQEGLTLFAIPRQPQPLLDALDHGQSIYLDVTMQVFVSNVIRKYRDHQKTPTASIACHANHEIKLVISTLETPEKWESFVWPLQALDYPARIGQQMQQLLQECQVEEITLLSDVQPTLDKDIPLFITPSLAAHYA